MVEATRLGEEVGLRLGRSDHLKHDGIYVTQVHLVGIMKSHMVENHGKSIEFHRFHQFHTHLTWVCCLICLGDPE